MLSKSLSLSRYLACLRKRSFASRDRNAHREAET